MNLKALRCALVWLGFGAAATTSLHGYALRTDDSGVYVVKWHQSTATMQIKLPNVANLSDGNSQQSSVSAAMQAWNIKLGTLQFTPVLSSPGPYSNTNDINEIVMDSDIDGDAFPNGALAVTIAYARGNDAAETDIVFNTAYTWDSYRGTLHTPYDLHRIAIHELGHALGLDHPDEHGQFRVAIMNSHASNVDALQSDDIAGGQILYGSPGFVPPNDSFAAATAITLSDGTHTVTGTNVAATREPGEGNHAESTGIRSVWWKWTAPYNGTMTLTTLGSHFDTVLEVFSGTTLASLTSLGANDDQETVEQNPGPQRKRTSFVSFNAVAGTTYHIVVDGWGAEDQPVVTGYTGEITLNLAFAPSVPPTFTRHPANESVRAGDLARFRVDVEGKPAPTVIWQRLSTDGTWTNLTNGGAYSGTRGILLEVTTTLAMDGDQFRCVATSSAGTATSNAATLDVLPIPVPVIITQPSDVTAATGETATLQVSTTGATGFQWYRNGAPLEGKTAATLAITELQASDAAAYHVVVSNPGGSVASSSVTLTVIPLPTITNHGSRRHVVGTGQTISFSTTVSGTGNVSLQWYFNGRPISGATGSTYSRAFSGLADAGAYWVAATDSHGTRHGPPFFVIYAPASTQIVQWGTIATESQPLPTGLTTAVAVDVGWDSAIALKRDGTIVQWGYPVFAGLIPPIDDAVDVAVGRMGAMALRADGTVVTSGSSFGTVPVGLKNVAAIDCSAQAAVALKTDGTVVAWPSYAAAPAGLSGVVAIAAADYQFYALKADGTVVSWGDRPGEPAAGLTNVVGMSGGIYHSLFLRADGTIAANNGSGQDLSPPAGLTGVAAIASGSYHGTALKSDGTVVGWGNNYSGGASPPAIGKVYAIAAGGYSTLALRDASTDAAPVISSAPVAQTVTEGETASFSVSASGNGTLLQYQWRKNGTAIAGETTATLTLTETEPADAGAYDVVVTNHVGSTSSASATLTIRPLPVVTNIGSLRQVLAAGQTLAIDVSASGTGALSYQWYHNGRPIAGATTADLNRVVSGPSDAGAYWAAVTDSNGTRHGPPFFVIPSHGETHVVGWGNNYSGQATPPASLTSAISLAVGWSSVIAVKLDGTVTAWSGFQNSLPAGLTDVVAAAAGRDGALLVKADGTVVGIGDHYGRVPAGLKHVVAVACGTDFGLALKTDGTVASWSGLTTPAGLRDVVAIAAGGNHALALKRDGTVFTWSGDPNGPPQPPADLANVVAISGGMNYSIALKADGTIAEWDSDHTSGVRSFAPGGLSDVVAIGAGSSHTLALKADGTVVAWGFSIYGKNSVPSGLGRAFGICAGSHVSFALLDGPRAPTPVLISPENAAAWNGEAAELTVSAAAGTSATFQWQRDGADVTGGTSTTLRLSPMQPALAGLYTAVATNGGAITTSHPAVVGIYSYNRVTGDGTQVGFDIQHSNGNVYDQVLLQGAAATITAGWGKIVRMSFIDLTNDIVQVEFSGSGALTLVLDASSGPAAPLNYQQPAVSYMKGHAGIVITGTDHNTHVSVFSVGRANAVDQSLFRDGVDYDGVADIAYIAISTHTGKFGGVRAANASFMNTKGYAGLYAPNVEFTGPVYIGDITAADRASPVIIVGAAPDLQINGGDLLQSNGQPVAVNGVTQMRFTAGTNSHGVYYAPQPNRARVELNGSDVTDDVVVGP